MINLQYVSFQKWSQQIVEHCQMSRLNKYVHASCVMLLLAYLTVQHKIRNTTLTFPYVVTSRNSFCCIIVIWPMPNGGSDWWSSVSGHAAESVEFMTTGVGQSLTLPWRTCDWPSTRSAHLLQRLDDVAWSSSHDKAGARRIPNKEKRHLKLQRHTEAPFIDQRQLKLAQSQR